MFTIALDEQGDFENLKNKLNTEPVFIGGVLYDDCEDLDDYETEKMRLQSYLRNVCDDAGGVYPNDLHYSTEGGSNNGQVVKKVKTIFGTTIKEFLEAGTWKNLDLGYKPRKGRYYIFVSLRGEHGKEALLARNVSEAVREDFASNLYLHMAENVVERMLFHNPIIPNMGQVRLELATRRVVLEGSDRTKKMKEYEKLGYVAEQRKESQHRPRTSEYILTNPANYRTAVEREMIHSGENTLMIDRIGVKSIYYKNPDRRGRMAFLYLADAICSHLSFNRSGETESEWVESFDSIAESINGKCRNLIWGYDEADEYFEKSWRKIEEGDYYTALSLSFDGMKCESAMRAFYGRKWFPLVVEAAVENANAVDFSTAIKKFKDSTMDNNLNQEKMVYIFEALEKVGDCVCFSNRKEEAELYDLYDAGVSVYTHIGDSVKAMKCYEKTQQYAEYVATEVFLRTRNRMVVFLGDMLEFSKALSIADENVKYHELLSSMKRQIFKDECYESLNHAIALSQRAQIYAFMEDVRAEEDFLMALETMDPETPDRLITESYLLHYYISAGNKEKYDKLAKDFFGGNTSLVEQFNYLVKEGSKPQARFSLKFALYVYIKSIYAFYLDCIPEKLLNKFKSIEKSLSDMDKAAAKHINGHPWEIIYKYLALIMYKYQAQDEADLYIKKIGFFADNSKGIIKSIANEGLRICIAEENEKDYAYKSSFTYMYV